MVKDIFRNEIERMGVPPILISLYDLMVEDRLEDRLRNVDSLYIFGQTRDNEDACFESSRKLLDTVQIKEVLVDNLPGQNGYPGFSMWAEKLSKKYGITPNPLEIIEEGRGYNTLIESESLVRHSNKNNLKSFYLIAPRFHLIRAFMTASSVAIRENPEINFFAYPGAEQDWNQTVTHSQGILKGKRTDLIRGEIERIRKYQGKGDIEPTAKIIDYMSNRRT